MTMNLNLNERDYEVLLQMELDRVFCLKNTVVSDKNIEVQLEELKNIFAVSTPDSSGEYICIKSNLGFNGGNISLIEYSQDSTCKQYSDSLFVTCKKYHCADILIEPHDYPKVQPYNRQSPYHVPHSYSSLQIVEGSVFNVLDRIEKCNSSLSFSFRNIADYNQYWKLANIELFVKKEDIIRFLKQYISIFISDEETIANLKNIVSRYMLSLHESIA